MATQKSDLKYDGFVDNVRPDPKSNEQVTLLQGYLGKSSEPDHVRVYFDEELNNFVDLPKADILHCEPNDKAENPLGGSRVWVKKATVVTFGDPAAANRAKSSFLEGDLLSAYGNMGLGAEQVPAGLQSKICTILRTQATICCPSKLTPCQVSIKAPCPGVSIEQPTCFKTCLQVSCFQTCLQPSCGATCHQPSCFQTCHLPTCFKTCIQPSCHQTCHQPSCFQTCLHPSCGITCHNPSCFQTCVKTCNPQFCPITCHTGSIVVTLACTAVDPTPTIETNPGFAAQQQGYMGTFNPFNTGGFGM